MPYVVPGTAPIYGGTVGQLTATTSQMYIASTSAWVNAAAVNGTADYFVPAGLLVQGSADALLVNSPQLFVPLNVAKGP